MGPAWESIRRWYGRVVKEDAPPLAVLATLLPISLLVLAISLFGLYRVFTMPTQTDQHEAVPMVTYRQEGEFDYTVSLRDNSLFAANQLGPGQTYFRQLAERIEGTFSYRFSSEPPVPDPAFECRATLTFGSPDLWQREEILVDTVKTEQAFSVPFDLSLERFENLIETFRAQTGAGLSSPQLTVRVTVEPQIETEHGPIAELFEQALTFSFSDQTIEGGDGLEKSQPGSITRMVSESTPGLGQREATGLKVAFGVVAAVSLFLLGLLVWLYGPTVRRVPAQEKELQQARKRLQGLLVQTSRLPPVEEGEIVVRLHSLDELLGLAEEMFRPVMCSPSRNGTVYCMIDGLTSMRYEYVSLSSDGSESR